MIKARNVEHVLVEVEKRIEVAWDTRDTVSGDKPQNRRLTFDYVRFLQQVFGDPSPTIGNLIVCADMDDEDLQECNERLFTIHEKFVKFGDFFYWEDVEPILDSIREFYDFWVYRYGTRLVPEGKPITEMTNAEKWVMIELANQRLAMSPEPNID